MAPYVPPGWVQDMKRGGVEGKLNGNFLRLIPGLFGKNKLIGRFKMAAGDVIKMKKL